MKYRIRKFIAPAVLLMSAGGVLLLTHDIWQPYLAEAKEVFSSPESVREFMAGFGIWAPVVFFLLQVAQVLLSPIPAGATTLAGAFAFGVWPGLALGLSGSIAGSVIVFCAVRRWGEPLVVRIVGEELFRRYSGRLGRKGWWLFAIFLLPFLPDDAVSAVAGISLVSFRRFFVLMSVGRLPGTMATVLLASDGVTGTSVVWISLGIGLLVLLTLGVLYRKRLEAWIVGRMDDGHEVEERSEQPGRELEKVG